MKVRTRDGVVDLPYLVEDRDRHGNVRIYFKRRGCPKVRLRAEAGSDAFMRAYRAARDRGEAEAEPAEVKRSGSVRWLATLYMGSGDWKRLDEETRRNRRRVLAPILEKYGDRPADTMEPKHVRVIMDEKEGPEAANQRLKALRALYKWGVAADHVRANPARDVPPIRTGSEGWHTMTAAEMAQFANRHPIGTKPYLAFAMLVFTGVRRCDLVRLGRQMERDGTLYVREQKGRGRQAKVTPVPIHPALRAALKAGPTGDLTYLVTEYGKPFTVNGFGNWFRARCDEAGLPHCSAHSVRKGVATLLAEGEATEHQLMAAFGWTTPQQAAGYTRKANRERLAKAAWARLGDVLSPTGSESGTHQPKKGSKIIDLRK